MYSCKVTIIFFALLIIDVFTSSWSESKEKEPMQINECKKGHQPLVQYYDYDGIQYLFFSQRVTWEEAQILCKNYNSRLAILNTLAKSVNVAQFLAESNIEMGDTWIGGRQVNSVWYWIDKEVGPWRNVLSAEPNIENFPPWSRIPNRSTKECLAINRQSHKNPIFIDFDCRLFKYFICEKNTDDAIDIPRPLKWVEVNRNTFTLYSGKVTWHEAAKFCRIKGLRLAIVNNLLLTHILANSMSKSRPDFERMWIGAYFSYGQWIWLATGSILNNFMNETGYESSWTLSQPMQNNGCLVLDKHLNYNSTFIVTPCNHKRDFICEEYPDNEENDWRNEPNKFSHNNNTYIVYPMAKTWLESRTYCNNRGSVLAYIDHNNTISLIIDAMGDHPREISHVWLGGQYNSNTSEWFWIHNDKKINKNNDEFSFLPWIEPEGEKLLQTENIGYCLNLDRIDHIRPYIYGLNCNSKQPFICRTSCDHPPVVNNGVWNCRSLIESRECHLQCDQSHIMLGTSNVTCTLNNDWLQISDINLMEFPLCLNPADYATRMVQTLSQAIEKSSAYYVLLCHSSSIIKSMALKFSEWIFTAFPAAKHLKIGISSYVTNPPVYIPFNQTSSCKVTNTLRQIKNINKKLNITPNIPRFISDISSYDGRTVSIIAIIDSDCGLQHKEALQHFKFAGHHITIIGLKEHLNILLPLATVGFDGRHNLFLFDNDNFPIIINQLDKHGKKLKCQNYLNNSVDKFVGIKVVDELPTTIVPFKVKDLKNEDIVVHNIISTTVSGVKVIKELTTSTVKPAENTGDQDYDYKMRKR